LVPLPVMRAPVIKDLSDCDLAHGAAALDRLFDQAH
jgi:hypothetical protein